MTKFENETGRSMVEMLGVLAIIGVLSVGGIAGYTTAMNKHRANELLQQASLRAVAVSTQIQRGINNPTLAEFTNNSIGNAAFSSDIKNTLGNGTWTQGTDAYFSLKLTGVDEDVCTQMKAMVGENGIIRNISQNCEIITYRNDLTTAPEIPDCSSGIPSTLGDCNTECNRCSYSGSDGRHDGACNKFGKCVNPCPSNFVLMMALCAAPPETTGVGIECPETGSHFLGYRYDLKTKEYSCAYCLTGETMITLADGTCKRLDQVMPGDRVLCLNPETGALDIDEVVESDALEHKEHTEYDVWTFSDQTVVKTVYRHRFYNLDQQRMAYMDEWKMGEHAYTRSGKKVALVHHERVQETVRHYTLFTKKWNNYFANNLLSGNRHTPKIALSV